MPSGEAPAKGSATELDLDEYHDQAAIGGQRCLQVLDHEDVKTSHSANRVTAEHSSCRFFRYELNLGRLSQSHLSHQFPSQVGTLRPF